MTLQLLSDLLLKEAEGPNFGKVDDLGYPFRAAKAPRGSLFQFDREYVQSFNVFSLKSGSEMRSKARVSCFCRFQGSPWMAFDTSGEPMRRKLRSFSVQSAVTLPKFWPSLP